MVGGSSPPLLEFGPVSGFKFVVGFPYDFDLCCSLAKSRQFAQELLKLCPSLTGFGDRGQQFARGRGEFRRQNGSGNGRGREPSVSAHGG